MSGLAIFLSLVLVFMGAGRDLLLQASVWATGAAAVAAIPLMAWFYCQDARMRNPLKPAVTIGRLTEKDTLWLAAAGISFSYVLNLLLALLKLFDKFPDFSEEAGKAIYSNPFLVSLLIVGIIGPVAEELIFRGLVHLRIRDAIGSRWLSILFSSVIFGLIHGNMVQFIYAALFGVFMAWTLEHYQSLAASVLVHVSANVWSLVVSYYGKQMAALGGGSMFAVLVLLQIGVVIYSLCRIVSAERNGEEE